MALPEINAWGVETFRFTFFFTEPQIGLLGWWKSVTGVDPEQVLSRPQMGEHSESGAFLDGQLELKSAFNRVDWTFTYPFAGLPDAVPTKSMSQLRDDLIPAIGKWLINQSSKITRVAFGAIGLHPVRSIGEGNVLLGEYLPFIELDAGRARDLLIQINLPEKNDVLEGVDCNVISKWGVLTGQFMQMALGGLPAMVTNHMVRAELDLSTPVDRSNIIPSYVALDLVSHFVNTSCRVLQEGVRS